MDVPCQAFALLERNCASWGFRGVELVPRAVWTRESTLPFLLLDTGPGQGPRTLSLLPDHHLCVVDEEQIVTGVPEAMSSIARTIRATRRPVTLVSGPSATSDIELDRVEGVHGPRDLVVLVVSLPPGERSEKLDT